MCGQDKPRNTKYKTPKHLVPVDAAKAVNGDIVVEEFPVSLDGYTYPYGRIAYVKGRSQRPVVLVHHNFAGLKQFDIDQACFLAKVGYVGLAVDLYQETESFRYIDRACNEGCPVTFDEYCEKLWTENPLGLPDVRAMQPKESLKVHWDNTPKDENGKVHWQGVKHFIGAFLQMRKLLCEPKRWRGLMQANLDKAFKHPAVKSGYAAAMGYCLGGQSCLEQVRDGQPVQAVCSLHGLLHSRPTTEEEPFNPLKRMSKEEYQEKIAVPNRYNTSCRVLIQNGAHDKEVPQEDIQDFMQEMDAQEIDWRIENHARGPHGFALPPGCPGGEHYTETIDRRSTIATLSLFAEIWDFPQSAVECNAAGAKLGQAILPKAGPDSSQKSRVGFGLTMAAALGGAAVLLFQRLQRSRL